MRKFLWLLALCLILTGCTAKPVESATEPDFGILEHEGAHYRLREDLTTVLVLGLDAFAFEVDAMAYTNRMQADFLLLLVVDEAAKTCIPLHLNRDTMTRIRRLGVGGEGAGSFVGQLALAHTYGSGGSDSSLNAVRAVSELLWDAPVDHYITMTMDAVAAINDRLGGITVTVEEDFSHLDPALVPGQQVKLMGEQALTYVRARAGMADSSNLARMKRQQQYLSAFQTKLLETYRTDSTLLSGWLLELGEDFSTDCSVNQLDGLMKLLAQCEMAPFRELQGEAVQGEAFLEYHLNEERLLETALELFYEKQD